MQAPDLLSPHFTFGELTNTSNLAYLDTNRQEALAYLDAGKALAATLLEPIREHFGMPLFVHSAFRCAALNGATKGASKTSQHMKFEACDFHVQGHTLQEVFEWISKSSNLPYGQLILEGREPGKPTWIHVSLGEPWRSPELCRQRLIFDGTTYTRLA